MENNVSILPVWGAMGITWTGGWEGNDYPAFAIIGHPQSLCGYYKFIPQNNDTMEIHIRLYKNGVDVGGGQFKNSSAVLSWTPFVMSFSNYTEADSARIMILSCYNNDAPVPQGNSVLYIDNLNFDSLIVDGISEISEKNPFIIYPNPARRNFTIDFGNDHNDPIHLVIYNAIGNQVLDRQVLLVDGKTSLDVSTFASGPYFVGITVDDQSYYYRKLIIEK